MADERETPQPTLKGYNAWAFRRLKGARGTGPGPTAEWIIDRWISENGEFLEREFGIRRSDYTKVVQLRSEEERQGEAARSARKT